MNCSFWSLAGCRRIMVTGSSGSGKSTLTRALAEQLGLEAVHLDVHFWNPNWTETPFELWREKVKGLVAADSWVMDGSFTGTMDLSIPHADAIVILELPRSLCLYRAITRVLKYDSVNRRPDMAEGCDESFNPGFYRWIWSYPTQQLPILRQAISEYRQGARVIVLRSPEEVVRFLVAQEVQ